MAIKLKIPRGATFRKGWTWLSIVDITKQVTGFVRGYPTIVTAVAHGLPTGAIPAALLDLGQLSTVNENGEQSYDVEDRIEVKKLTADTFSVNVDSTDFAADVAGYLVYRVPKDLSGYDGRMQFRSTVDATTLSVAELNVSNGGLVLGGAEGTVDFVLTAAQAAGMVDDSGVWSIELIAPGPGDTTRFREGTFEMSPDLNRP